MFKLEKVTWERIYCDLTVSADASETAVDDLSFFLINDRQSVAARLFIEDRSETSLRLRLNVTNTGINRCVESGRYLLVAASGTNVLCPVLCDTSSQIMAGWSNHFLYDGDSGCYTITFMVNEFTDLPELNILFYDMLRWSGALRLLSKRWCIAAVRAAMKIMRRVLPRGGGKKRILFLSQMDDSLSLNMRAVHDRLIDRGLESDYRIDCFLRNISERKLRLRDLLLQLKLINRADVILVDDYVNILTHFPPDEGTKLIQLWHAGAGFKGVGYSRWGHYGCPAPWCVHRRYDYCIAGSASIAPFFSEQFGILDEQIIPTGMPRMDRFLNPEHRKNVTHALYETYPVLKGRRIVLFAPTYRGQERKNAFYPYELIDFCALYHYCEQKNAIILFKMHPWVRTPVPIPQEYADRMLDLSRYPDINDLFYITDLLITDYSSSIYEFTLMQKPVLLFAFDENQYASSRGFHRDYESNVPGRICKTFDSLLAAMRSGDFEEEKVKTFLPFYFDHVDSGSTDRVIDWLILGKLPVRYRNALDRRRAENAQIRSLRLYRPDPESWERCRIEKTAPETVRLTE